MTFHSIDRSEYDSLFSFITSRKIRILNLQAADTRAIAVRSEVLLSVLVVQGN